MSEPQPQPSPVVWGECGPEARPACAALDAALPELGWAVGQCLRVPGIHEVRIEYPTAAGRVIWKIRHDGRWALTGEAAPASGDAWIIAVGSGPDDTVRPIAAIGRAWLRANGHPWTVDVGELDKFRWIFRFILPFGASLN